MTQFTSAELSEQLDAVRWEIAARRRNYPAFVEDKRMTKAAADKAIAVMEALAVTVEKVKMCAEVSEEIKAGK